MPFWKRQNYLLWISIGTAVMVLAMVLLLVNQVAVVSRQVALPEVSDMEALMCFAESRSALEGLSEPFCEELDEALQDLDMDKALALCSARLLA